MTARITGVSKRLRDRVREILRDDRGSVSAEFVMTLPAIGATIVLCVAAVALSAHHLNLTAAAHQVARLEARGEPVNENWLTALGDSVVVTRTMIGDTLCVELRSRPGAGPLSGISIAARGCALTSDS